MNLAAWGGENWFSAVQTAGIVGGLCFTGLALRREARSRRSTNLLQLTAQHRALWTEVLGRPTLQRVLSTDVDLNQAPVTLEEQLFVRFLLLHLASAYQAIKADVLDEPEGLSADIRTFLVLPIPQAVWQLVKPFQDEAFVRFVESHFSHKSSSG